MKDARKDFSDAEIARRRDEVIRRMANTPPQHRVATPDPRPKKKTKAGQSRPAPKNKAKGA